MRSTEARADTDQKFSDWLGATGLPGTGMYGPDQAVGSWRDMMAAAVVVQSMLGVSPSAYHEACEVMGPENAAIAIACIFERGGHINSPGSYFRDLTRKGGEERILTRADADGAA